MGLYDSLFIDCPECGKELEFQSKEGDCNMLRCTSYNILSRCVPWFVGRDLHCTCGAWVELVPYVPPKIVARSKPHIKGR